MSIEEVDEPFLVKAISPNNSTEKTELKFKKGQTITVERINTETSDYFGFYDAGKKEGWFQDYYVTKMKGAKPEVRKYGEKGGGASGSGDKKVDKAPKPKKEDSKKSLKDIPTDPPLTAKGTLDGSTSRNSSQKAASAEENSNSDVNSSSDDLPSKSPRKSTGAASAGNASKESVGGTPSRKELEKAAKKQAAQQKKADKIAKKQEKIAKKETKKKTRTLTKGQAAAHVADPTGIPAIVEDTISFLEKEDRLKQEGIFRVSGSLNDVKSIRETYVKGKPVELSKVHDPHTVAGVLKIYFRESSNPLLTFEFYQVWITTMAEGAEDAKQLAIKIRRVIKRLPPQNQAILKRLMGLLFKVSANADKNLMNVNNIAIVFAPTLLRPPGDQIDLAIQHSSYSNNLVKFMIENFETVFADEDEDEENEDKDFENKMKRGSLLLARGSFIGTRPDLATITGAEETHQLQHVEVVTAADAAKSAEKPADHAKPVQPSPEESDSGTVTDPEENGESDADDTPAGGAVGPFTMEEMMDKILEGAVAEVDEFLATLDPTEASNTKKELLRRIDEVLKTEEFGD